MLLGREGACPKNRIHYYKDRKGLKAEMVLVHFKNDAMKGPQHLPLAKANLQVAAMLEQASAQYKVLVQGVHVDTLFYMHDGTMYRGPYFSIVGGNILSFGAERCTANTFRHLFITAYRDFLASPTTQLLGLTTQQLEEAAAAMTLNSPAVWDAAYDDTNVSRGIHSCLSLWPKFVEFVHEQHLDKASQEPWDPLVVAMADLAL